MGLYKNQVSDQPCVYPYFFDPIQNCVFSSSALLETSSLCCTFLEIFEITFHCKLEIFFMNGIIEYGSLCKYIVLVIESKIYENKVTLKPYCTIIEREICSCATKERSINFGRLLGFFTQFIQNYWKRFMEYFL